MKINIEPKKEFPDMTLEEKLIEVECMLTSANALLRSIRKEISDNEKRDISSSAF